jgi:hypothetical protein
LAFQNAFPARARLRIKQEKAPMEEIDTKGSEARIRRLAHRFGYHVVKSRQRKHVPNLDNHGDYMLIENATNVVAIGERFDASLADIEDFLCPAFDDEAVS